MRLDTPLAACAALAAVLRPRRSPPRPCEASPQLEDPTSPTDHVPVAQMQQFKGRTWERFGELQTGN